MENQRDYKIRPDRNTSAPDAVARRGLRVSLVGLLLVVVLLGCAQSGFIKVHREEETPERRSVYSTEVRQPTGAISPASLSLDLVSDDQAAQATGHDGRPVTTVGELASRPIAWLGSIFTGKATPEAAPATQEPLTQHVGTPAARPDKKTDMVNDTRRQSAQRVVVRASTGASQASDQALAQMTWMPALGVGLCVLAVALIAAKAWFPLLPLELGVGLLLLGIAVIALPMLLDRYLWLLMLVAVLFFAFNVWRLNKIESVRQFLGLGPSQPQNQPYNQTQA